jgi:hypothetical protein
MDAGVDSLGAVDFRANLVKLMPTASVPTTVVFDYPSIRAIAQLISSQVETQLDEIRVVRNSCRNLDYGESRFEEGERYLRFAVTFSGTSCRFPTCSSRASHMLLALFVSADGMVETPMARWDL